MNMWAPTDWLTLLLLLLGIVLLAIEGFASFRLKSLTILSNPLWFLRSSGLETLSNRFRIMYILVLIAFISVFITWVTRGG